MKKYSTLLGAAVVGLSATASYAGITLSATPVNLTDLTTELYGPGGTDPTLTNAGWSGYFLVLTADGTGGSTALRGYDFANVGGQPESPYNQPQTNIGIRGNIFQEWLVVSGKTGTVTNPTPDNASGQPGLDAYDSFFYRAPNLTPSGSNPYFPGLLNDAYGSNPVEDNNLQNGSNPPYTQSPVADITGYNYGVGTIMTAAAVFDAAAGFPTSQTIAFIIVPTSTPTTIRGFALDQNNQGWGIDFTLNPSVVIPEPASLGLLALGGLGLLARRRRA